MLVLIGAIITLAALASALTIIVILVAACHYAWSGDRYLWR